MSHIYCKAIVVFCFLEGIMVVTAILLVNIFKKKDKPNQSHSVLDTMVPAANNHSTARRAGDSIASQKNKIRVEDK